MSLDVYLTRLEPTEVFEANITHNLSAMANEANIYNHLWHPERIGIKKAGDLIQPLTTGLALMRSDPKRFKAFNAKNGWGSYKHFVPWIQEYLKACIDFPDADIEVNR